MTLIVNCLGSRNNLATEKLQDSAVGPENPGEKNSIHENLPPATGSVNQDKRRKIFIAINAKQQLAILNSIDFTPAPKDVADGEPEGKETML